jgi:small subunit ribosomal protein S16
VVRIRLRRMGAKKSPYYRIVVTDKRSPRDGRFIEAIGTYDPNTKPETVHLEMERAAHWLANGAQASEGAIRILQRAKLVDEHGKAIAYTPAEAVGEPVSEAGAAASA